MLISLIFVTLSVNACGWSKKRSKKPAIQEYQCAFGYCIDQTKNQPNGNKLCMNNYASKELALENCEKYQCEKIAKYQFNGKGLMEHQLKPIKKICLRSLATNVAVFRGEWLYKSNSLVLFEILKKNKKDTSCAKLSEGVEIINPELIQAEIRSSVAEVKSGVTEIQSDLQIDGYACSYGNCIAQNATHQPNGNKLCMANFPSIEIAQKNCQIHNCDKIAKYDVNGTDMFEILSNTNAVDPSCQVLTDEISLINPELTYRVRRQTEGVFQCTPLGNLKCILRTAPPQKYKRYCELNFSTSKQARKFCRENSCDGVSSFNVGNTRLFEVFNIVENPSSECLQVDSSLVKRKEKNQPKTNLKRGLNNYPNQSSTQSRITTQRSDGWYQYGCAGDDKCLPAKNKWTFWQPNGNKFCFTNYPSIDLAENKCNQFNTYWPGSCTHIVSYQMYNNEYRWELLNKNSKTKCQRNFNSPDIQIVPFINPRNTYQHNQIRQNPSQPKSPYRQRRSLPTESILNIHDHDEQPFQQKQIYYRDENITEIIVDAHKEFEKNTFFLLPNIGLKISIIGNHTCIIADINAYKIDDLEEEFSTAESMEDARQNNTIEFEWSSGYKDSDFNLHYLPSRVQERCTNLEILELEYLFRGTKKGGSTIDAKVMVLPSMEHSRHTRAHKVQCPSSHCSQGLMQAQCSPNQQCRSLGRQLPSCWFAMGTTSYSTDFGMRQLVTNYYHHTNIDMACLPCCHLSSNHSKMPVCSQVLSVGDLCNWYANNGRCPSFN